MLPESPDSDDLDPESNSRTHWYVRWHRAEMAFIALAVVVSLCVIAVVMAASAWLIWEIWLLHS